MNLTDKAREHIENTLVKLNKSYFRIEVRSGGCSGFQYHFSTEDTASPDDHVLPLLSPALFVVVDPVSFPLIEGSEVDYKEDLNGAALSILNPNASRCCGCGKSFTA